MSVRMQRAGFLPRRPLALPREADGPDRALAGQAYRRIK